MEKKSYFLRHLGLVLLCILLATQANAQNITVTGTVTDSFGPVIGASVIVEGTSNGCITDFDGNSVSAMFLLMELSHSLTSAIRHRKLP